MDQLSDFIQANPDPRELKRALAVQMVRQQYRHREIQSVLQVSSGFISKWTQTFEQHGVEGLRLQYKGSSGYLDAQQRQAALEWLEQKNYWDLQELQAYLEDSYGVVFRSLQSYYELFHQAGISWKKTQKRNPKKDPQLVEKKTGDYSTTGSASSTN
jgi:putative transposase